MKAQKLKLSRLTKKLDKLYSQHVTVQIYYQAKMKLLLDPLEEKIEQLKKEIEETKEEIAVEEADSRYRDVHFFES